MLVSFHQEVASLDNISLWMLFLPFSCYGTLTLD